MDEEALAGRFGPCIMEDRRWMQKKKPPFQVIPNYSINVVTNWNESKEVPAEQACKHIACATSDRCRPLPHA
jgi:hypothetical protein